MADAHPFHTPDFIREREAWFKLGVHMMAGVIIFAGLVIGFLVSVASLFVHIEPHLAAGAAVLGMWVSTAVAGTYLDFSARRRALEGGVVVDRF